MLLAAVDHSAHALLDGAVLGVDASDARHRLGALRIPADVPAVGEAGVGSKCGLVHSIRAVAQALLKTLVLGEGAVHDVVLPVPHHAGVVVHGNPYVPCYTVVHCGDAGLELAASGAYLGKGHHEVIAADEIAFRPGIDPSVAVAVVCEVQIQLGCVSSTAGPGGAYASDEVAVEYLGMGGVDASLHALQPVAVLHYLGDGAVGCGHLGPVELGRRGHQLARA